MLLKSVTVLTAVYNSANFLEQTVESVAKQTCLPAEHIIIDDGSTDESLSVAMRLAKKYPNLRIISHNVNKGYPAALNSGIANSKTDYVAILDSDDIAIPQWLEIVFPLINSDSQIGAVGGGCVIMTATGDVTGCRQYCDSSGDVTEQIADGYYKILHPGTIYRRSCLAMIGGYNVDLKSLEDNDLYLGLSSITKIFSVGVPLVYYRRHPESESRKTDEYSHLAFEYLRNKSNLLKSGLTVNKANEELSPLIKSLASLPRLSKKSLGRYQLEIALAFENGGRKSKAINGFLLSFKYIENRKYALRGIFRCIVPKCIWMIAKKILKR